MAYFLGKGMGSNMDDLFPDIGQSKGGCLERCREQLALDPGFDYQGCVDGCGGMRVQPGETTVLGDVTGPGTITGPVIPPVVADEDRPFNPYGTAETQPGTNFLDDLIASMFGKGFEDVRGVGGRTREATFDMLAREGLLGTGAAVGKAQDVAWQTERGISDLMRGAEQWKYQQEQETMNQLLQYLFSMMGSWR